MTKTIIKFKYIAPALRLPRYIYIYTVKLVPFVSIGVFLRRGGCIHIPFFIVNILWKTMHSKYPPPLFLQGWHLNGHIHVYLQARSNRNEKQYWTINKFQNGTDFEKDNNDKDYDCSLNNLSSFFVSVQFIILICGILVCTYVQYRWIESIWLNQNEVLFEIMNGSDNSSFPLNS